jgi:hypothetical protein
MTFLSAVAANRRRASVGFGENTIMTRWPAFISLLLPLAFHAAAILPTSAAQTVPRPAGSFLKTAIVPVAAPDAATPAQDVTLTLPDGSETRLRVSTIRRIRKTLPSESTHGAKTRIDWVDTLLVREPPEVVAASVGQILPSLGKLQMPDGSPIWFDVLDAYGPMPLTADKLRSGVLSGMILGRKIQYLANTPEEVHAEIAAKGGRPLPLPGSSGIASNEQQARTRSIAEPLEVWDADIPQ